ncbi:MAG: prepilin peptidase [Candidatus Paceibacterota bacterium]
MDFLILILLFCFGVLIGSFLNVVILRYNTGLSFWSGRSQCLTCTHTLYWYDLFPLGTFLVNRMRCRYCETRLSSQYPLVELGLGCLFALLGLVYEFELAMAPLLFLSASILSFLVLIFVYDLRHKIIPNAHVYSFIVLSGLYLLVTHFFHTPTNLLLDLLAGPLLAFPFWALWFFSQGTWMGFGDVKLAWGIGWFLGFSAGVSAIILAFWIGAVVSLSIIAYNKIQEKRATSAWMKSLSMKSEIPFAPFLIAGCLIVFYCNISVIDLSILFGG